MNEPDPKTIEAFLITYRRTLAALLAQAAQYSTDQLPASIAHDIGAARAAISRLKAALCEFQNERCQFFELLLRLGGKTHCNAEKLGTVISGIITGVSGIRTKLLHRHPARDLAHPQLLAHR